MIIFLFGMPGAGKSAVGQQLAQMLGTVFIEGDDSYTDKDKATIIKRILTDEESMAFIDRLILDLKEKSYGKNIVVAGQSLVLEKQRKRVKAAFGDSVKLVCIDVPVELAVERVKTRNNGPHFFGEEQYKIRMNRFEAAETFDIRVTNQGSINDTATTIKNKVEELYRISVQCVTP